MSAAGADSRASDPRLRATLAAALLALVVAVFWPVRGHPFVDFDDHIYLRDNPMLADPLSAESLARAFEPYEANWIPLTWISFQVDRALYGAGPSGVHTVNLGLHALATLLLFLALERMTVAPWRSAFVAAVFGVHPLHVESVAWAAERKDVLCGLFWMLALWCYAGTGERLGRARGAGVALCLALGLLAKPAIVTLPFALLLLDFWPLRRLGLRAVLEKLPLLALVIAGSAATLAVQGSTGALSFGERLGAGARIANALESYVVYVGQAFWPSGLAVLYPYPAEWSAARAAAAGALLAAATAVVWWQRGPRPVLLVGWLWFLGTLVPMIGIVQAGWQARADRYTYFPLIGLALMVAWLGGELAGRRRALRGAVAVAGVAALVALALAARVQLGTWRDTETLFRRALAVTQDNVVAHYRLGVELQRQGRIDEADEQYAAAVALAPPWVHPYLTRADLLASRGELDEAARLYRSVLRLERDHLDALAGLGITELRAGRPERARAPLERARTLGLEAPELHAALAMIAGAEGRPATAIAHNRRALELNPELTQVANNLAWLLATTQDERLRDPDEAVRLAERAVRESGGADPGFLDTLAAAYAAAGRFDEALRTAERAAGLAAEEGAAALAAEIRSRAALYRQRTGYLEAADR